MKVIRARVHDRQIKELKEKTADGGEPPAGRGDLLNKRIRTYNVPQNRVTDHRIDLALYKLNQIMAGDLDELLEKLAVYFQIEALKHGEL